jgi:hypothetical protein
MNTVKQDFVKVLATIQNASWVRFKKPKKIFLAMAKRRATLRRKDAKKELNRLYDLFLLFLANFLRPASYVIRNGAGAAQRGPLDRPLREAPCF